MFAHRLPLFKLLGFQVWVDWSWLILALLITWSLATGVFPALVEDDLTTPTFWTMGAVGALGLFISIILHELGHSVVARRFGMRMRGITLFIFGGVAEMGDEPPSAKAEFFMAIGGPIVSVIIGVVMIAITGLGVSMDWPVAVRSVTGWLGWINLLLAAFNMLPAFPLDGGRVLRAALWYTKNDLRWATRITSSIGAGFGMLLIALGAFSLVFGNTIGGIWWIILGLFVRGAARSSYQQVIIRRSLEGHRVSDFMSPDPVCVDADISVDELINNYFYRHYHKLYPVTENGRLVGCVSISGVKSLERDRWGETRVGDIAQRCDDENTIAPDEDAMRALDKLNRNSISRLMVVDDGRVVGIIALKDLLRFLAMKTELDGA